MAQTGRIKGVVVDMQSGEPLIGANVVIVGTNSGATTDVNGSYLITQVSPGQYNLKASYIGYQNVTLQGIRVVSGLTAEGNFKLPSSDIVTAEMVIVSQRPLIEKSATNAIRIVTTEDLESLPVRAINDIVGLQAGVVLQDNNTYIRGSRPDETGYVVAGANTKDILSKNGGNTVNVTPDALQEITIQAGGYTAEFGNANAGIISEDFKTGSNGFHFSARAETDNFGNYPGQKFLNTYSYGYSNITLTASGPITNNLKFFISGENNFNRDNNPTFFYGNPSAYSDGALFANTSIHDNGLFGGDTSSSQILKWNGGNLPGQLTNRYTTNGTLLLDMKPLIVRFAGAFTWQRQEQGGSNIRSIYDLARIPMNDQNNLLLDLKGTYFISAKSFVEADVNFMDRRSKTYDPLFKDNFLAYDDSLAVAQYGYKYASYTSGPNPYSFYGFPFNAPGTDLTAYEKAEQQYYGGSVSYTAQFDKHELKAGGSYQRWTMRDYSNAGYGGILHQLMLNPELATDPTQVDLIIRQNSGINLSNYGYDVFGNETSGSGDFGPKHPTFASAYLQDRIEVGDLIINAGLRYDYLSMDTWKLVNPLNPTYNKTEELISDSSLTKSGSYAYISPRLGFSFPVTDRTVFHLQYGKFVQAPALEDAFQGITYGARILQGGTSYTTPLAYDLQPIRTTSYEIGFTQQFTDFAAFDLTAFYKDINGQIQYKMVTPAAGGQVTQAYPVFTNQDFSTNKGVELSLRIRRMNRIRAEINYTYADARGTNSTPTGGSGAAQTTGSLPTVIAPLDFSQTHRGTIMLDYRFAKNDGGSILEQLGINALFTFNSGHPFTQLEGVDKIGLGQNAAWTGGIANIGDSRSNTPVEPINSSTTPWNFNIDLRIDKTVSILNFDVNIYVYVQNILDTKNVINVYYATGNAYNDGFLQSAIAQKLIASATYTQRFADLYEAIDLANRQANFNRNGFDLFGTPRQLRAGFLINF
jgi:outer membrane receptor for ferrienterochelin and colicin